MSATDQRCLSSYPSLGLKTQKQQWWGHPPVSFYNSVQASKSIWESPGHCPKPSLILDFRDREAPPTGHPGMSQCQAGTTALSSFPWQGPLQGHLAEPELWQWSSPRLPSYVCNSPCTEARVGPLEVRLRWSVLLQRRHFKLLSAFIACVCSLWGAWPDLTCKKPWSLDSLAQDSPYNTLH